MPPTPTSIFVSAPDGLKLHVRSTGPANARGVPVVCLPGLTRTTADFDAVAQALAKRGRRVIAVDYRGRGLSDYDRNPDNYTVTVELADLIAVLTALELDAGDLHWHLARRHSGDAARRGAAERNRRGGAQRHRPGDRAEGADADQRLCR